MPGQRGHRGGLYHALFMRRNSQGYPCGMVADPESIANGTTMHARRLIAPINSSGLRYTRNQINWVGGMGLQGSQPTGIVGAPTFDFALTAHDEVWEALFTRTAIDETIATDYPVTAANIQQTVPVDGMLILSVGETPIGGTFGYRHFMYPNITIAKADDGEGNQTTGDNPLGARYNVTVNMAERTPFGLLFEDTSLGVENDIDGLVKWRTRWPIHVTSYKGVDSATSFVLGYKPINTEHAGAKNVFTQDGALAHADVSGVSDSTGAVTITEQDGAEFWVAAYETLYKAVA